MHVDFKHLCKSEAAVASTSASVSTCCNKGVVSFPRMLNQRKLYNAGDYTMQYKFLCQLLLAG